MATTHISSRLQQEATDNISEKLEVLETWVAKKIPLLPKRPGPKRIREENEFDYFPDSEAAFCKWTAEDNHPRTVQLYPQLLHFRSLSSSTLSKNVLLRERLTIALDKLKQKVKSQIPRSDSAEEINKLKSDRDRWKNIAEIQEQDVRDLRVRLTETERLLREEKRARLSNESTLSLKIAEMNKEISTLTSSLNKITGLRQARQ